MRNTDDYEVIKRVNDFKHVIGMGLMSVALVLLVVIMLATVAGTAGCLRPEDWAQFHTPTTHFEIQRGDSSVSYESTRDSAGWLQGVEWDPTTQAFKAELVDFSGNSSDPLRAQGQRAESVAPMMAQYAALQEVYGRNAVAIIDSAWSGAVGAMNAYAGMQQGAKPAGIETWGGSLPPELRPFAEILLGPGSATDKKARLSELLLEE